MGKRRYFSEETIQKFFELNKNGKNLHEIAEIYKTYRVTIENRFKENNIPVLMHPTRTKYTVDKLDNFIKKDKNGCWIWTKAKTGKGYGYYVINGRTVLAHRSFYKKYKGEIKDKWVCHACDVPSCCNPDHLFLGTPKDNSVDKERKQRGVYRSKINAYTVLEIRKLLKTDMLQKDIADKYSVSKSTITFIKNNHTFKWLKSIDDIIIK